MTTLPTVQPRRPKQGKNMTSADSLNHLLNFSLPPRNPPVVHPRRSRRQATPHGVWNKEKFLNANYRFVMKPIASGDYTVHFADPDIFFQWQDILQIIVPRTSAFAAAGTSSRAHDTHSTDEGHITCPICLSEPRCPRMTKCGHIYCYPCILRYLRTSDNPKWSRCPICFDSVNEKQLKAVKWFDFPYSAPLEPSPQSSSNVPSLGVELQMRLMLRPQITTLALPRSPSWPSDLIPPHQAPFHFMPDVFTFAKFMLATPAYLISALTQDVDELELEKRDLQAIHDSFGLSFVEGAEDNVRKQIAKAAALETAPLIQALEHSLHNLEDLEEKERRRQDSQQSYMRSPLDIPNTQFGGSVASNSLLAVGHSTSPTTTLRPPKPRRNVNPPPPSTSTYYYFQSATGSPIFLHPLDIRILLSHFHSYASFPDRITVKVEALTESTVNDDLRKRCKYLAHMAEGADVVFVEAELEGVVGSDTLKSFEGALKLRRTKRKEKGRKDERARVRAEEQEKEKLRDVAFQLRFSHTREQTVDRPPTPTPMVDIQATHVGAWGTRTFASTLNSAPSHSVRPADTNARLEDQYWDIDAAWHDLEEAQHRVGGGKKKKSKLVLSLNGDGGRRR